MKELFKEQIKELIKEWEEEINDISKEIDEQNELLHDKFVGDVGHRDSLVEKRANFERIIKRLRRANEA